MTLVRQIALISAGCQPWNLNIVDSSGTRFAYAATLAIYIYEWNPDSNQFYLHSIMSEHKKTISAIAWHLQDKNIIASCSTDYKICVWHVSKRKLLACLNTPHAVPSLMAWFPSDNDCLAYCDGKGPLYLWKFLEQRESPASHPLTEIASVSSNITQISWHKTAPGRLAFGHADGTISLYLQGKKPQTHVKLASDGSISWLLWDPFSQNYLLICTANGRLQLIDSSTDIASIITAYSLPSKAVTIKCVAWLSEVPGAFVTGDAEAGVLRIWTVSNEKPQETYRLKQVGFKTLCVLPSENTSENLSESTTKMKFSSRIVCLFFDGGVGVYNLRTLSWDFLRNMGHLETIFDCQYKPDNCDLLATASFDGTVKVWNVNTMEAVNSSLGDASIIYSLSWAPGDMNCLAVATSKSGIFIWNLKKGSIFKIQNHDKNCYIYCVSWNQKDARKIASAGGDGACMVHQTNGKLVQSFKHPAAVYGCDWNPNNENIVATACEDALVRVFYVGSGTDQPLKILSGHAGKVFRVKWSPLKDGILCSTSDDCSVRVWHYAQGIAVRVLLGHTSYTRGLLWCPEHPNIVISGSWDSTIRVWDISDGACMDIIEDHGADVYGLACHSERPFVFASTSRDSTVRLWSMLPLVSSLYIKLIVYKPQSDIFSPSAVQASGEFNETFGLYGPQSKIVKEIISKSESPSSITMWKAVSMLFCAPPGLCNLWELLSIMNNEEVDFTHYKTGIVHRKHITKLTMAMALEKELANVSFFGSGVNSCGKSENIKRAAECHVLTGNLKKYCELKIQLGDWLEAIALAPGVSLTYWKEVTARWLKLMEDQNNELISPLCIATNQIEELIEYYIKQNCLEKAHIVSIAFSEDLMPKSSLIEEKVSNKNDESDIFCAKIISSNVKRLAERCLLYGSPIKAACWHFSNDDMQPKFRSFLFTCIKKEMIGNPFILTLKITITNGLYCLVRGNELELAISVCLSLKLKNSSFKIATNYLAWKCARNHEWELALDVLSLCPETENDKICICINSGLSVTERNDLHKKIGLPSIEACDQEAQVAYENNCSVLKVVQLYLLSNEKKKGLDIGLQYIRDKLEESDWNLESLWQLLRTMSCVSSHLLQDITFDRHRFELQVYSAYIGALIAIRQGFYPIVVPLFTTALTLMKRVHNANLPLTEDMISSEMHAWITSRSSDSKSNSEKENIHKELMTKIMQDPPFGDFGVTIISGSNLPRHSDHHRCYLQSTAIQGPVYFLDDCKSAISINDALMWAKVNFFSPLKTGLLINPF